MQPKWTIERLQSLIASVEEGTTLEYKGSDKLSKPQRNAICKSVSALANSDGGVLIFGVDANEGNSKIDEGIDPIRWKADNGTEPELWLRQVLDAYIRRKVQGVLIESVNHPANTGKKIYIVDVPQSSHAPHQLIVERDKFEFHKRVGSKTQQMEEYEIRDVMNRHTAPDLWLEFSVSQENEDRFISEDNPHFILNIGLINESPTPAQSWFIAYWIDSKFEPFSNQAVPESFEVNGKSIFAKKSIHEFKPNVPIYGPFIFRTNGSVGGPMRRSVRLDSQTFERYLIPGMEAYLKWEIHSPSMTPRYGIERLSVSEEIDFTSNYEVSIQNAIKGLSQE